MNSEIEKADDADLDKKLFNFTISRNFALKCYAIYEISKLSESDIKYRLSSDYIDKDGNGEPLKFDSIYSNEVQEFLINFYCEYIFQGVSNEFLVRF